MQRGATKQGCKRGNAPPMACGGSARNAALSKLNWQGGGVGGDPGVTNCRGASASGNPQPWVAARLHKNLLHHRLLGAPLVREPLQAV